MNKCDLLARNVLSRSGFEYCKRGWYRCTEEFLQIINFQKSNWGNQYYINIGEDFLSGYKSKNNYPPEYKFPMKGRVDNITIHKEDLDCLDLENKISEEERITRIESLIVECISFLDRIRTKDDFIQEYKSSSLKGFAIYNSFLRAIIK